MQLTSFLRFFRHASWWISEGVNTQHCPYRHACDGRTSREVNPVNLCSGKAAPQYSCRWIILTEQLTANELHVAHASNFESSWSLYYHWHIVYFSRRHDQGSTWNILPLIVFVDDATQVRCDLRAYDWVSCLCVYYLRLAALIHTSVIHDCKCSHCK